VQALFVCALDDSLWLSENDAVDHVIKKHFGTFYQAERTATEPPKGKYTFVAQCGMSGAILGPPNYHDYQNQLRRVHAERFSRMPFEVYKSRVKIVRDEEVVKKWVDDQSFRTEYVCLNLPEPLRLGSMEQHFREVHKENIIKQVESHTLTGVVARNLRSSELSRLVRNVTEDQRRFPLQIATVLSQQFASRGLQFFKVNKTVTHVSVARPHFLDLAAVPVSDGVKSIVDFINSHPKCNRRLLVESLSPTPAVPPPAPVPAPEASSAATSAPAAPVAPAAATPTPEQTAIIADLHWLIHQGHVIEFANGILETAKKPLPKPPKPEPKPKAPVQAPMSPATAEGTVATEPATAPVEAPPPAAIEQAALTEDKPVASVPPSEPVSEPSPEMAEVPQSETPPSAIPEQPSELK
jgi:hypothetical protein